MHVQQNAGGHGIFSWKGRWMTKEEAENAGLPVPEHAGESILPEHGAPGEIIQPSGECRNMFVTAGIAAMIQDTFYGLTPVALWRYIAVGTDNTPAATAQTQLIAEVTAHGWGRVAATVSADTVNLAGDTGKHIGIFTLTAGASENINEIMIGNNASANTGTMLCRAVLASPGVTLPSGAVVTWTYKFTLANV